MEGALAGSKGDYDCPIDLRLFGTRNPIERADLRRKMESDRLPVNILAQKEKEAKKQRMADLKKLQSAKKGLGSKSGSGQQSEPGSSQTGFAGSQPQGSSTQIQSLEDIMHDSQRFNPREMGEVVEKFGAGEDVLKQMPVADFPEKLATKLLPYQRQALAWLLEKENPQLPPLGSTDVVQLWKRSSWDPKMFTNIATNFSMKNQLPVLASGGILAVSYNFC